jgi:hypothetical protein
MLAHDRLKYNFRILLITAVIPVNPDPVHLMYTKYFLFPNHRDVVFCLAGNDTIGTACTGTEVNGESPVMMQILPFLVKALSMLREMCMQFVPGHRIFFIFG